MAKQYKDKLAALKAIVNGKQPFDVLRPPQHFVIIKRTERDVVSYEYNGIEMNEEEYQQWYKANVREELDTMLHFIEVVDYSGEGAPELRTMEIHQEPIQAQKQPVKKERHTIIEDEPSPRVKAAIEPQLRPYAEHIEFNQRIYKKLFS